jgi:hypothetical protein
MSNKSYLNRPILLIRYSNINFPPPNIVFLGTIFEIM